MAIIVPEQSYPIDGNHRFLLVSWNNLANNDEGEPFILSQYADRSVQVVGTFGGADVDFQGSNDAINYTTLSDNLGVALSKTTAGLSQIMEVTTTIKPIVSNGDGTTSISVHMLVKS